MDRAFRPGLTWLRDFLIQEWPYILLGLVTISVTRIAALSALLKPYGLIAWMGVGIVSALLLACAFWVFAAARRHWVLTRFEVKRAEATSVNPLEGHYSKQRLRMADFFHPFFQATTSAKFEDCELLGPAAVFMAGCSLGYCHFTNCETVIVKEHAQVQGLTVFKNCLFDRCKFFQVTFFMTKPQYLNMKQQSGAPPVISDGTAGDL